MDPFVDAVYPIALVAAGNLAVVGIASLVSERAHKVLAWVVTGFYVVTLAQAVTVGIDIADGGVPVVMTVAYLVASFALLPLLGISRMGSPEAAKDEPGRPVLQPDQMAKVDGVVAIVVAAAAATVAWRLAVIVAAGS